MKSRRAAIASSLIFALVVTGARAGRTEESPAVAEARALYTDGLRLYRAGVYDEAIAKLQASYRLVPAPGLLYDMAQAHRLKGDCAAARDLTAPTSTNLRTRRRLPSPARTSPR